MQRRSSSRMSRSSANSAAGLSESIKPSEVTWMLIRRVMFWLHQSFRFIFLRVPFLPGIYIFFFSNLSSQFSEGQRKAGKTAWQVVPTQVCFVTYHASHITPLSNTYSWISLSLSIYTYIYIYMWIYEYMRIFFLISCIFRLFHSEKLY